MASIFSLQNFISRAGNNRLMMVTDSDGKTSFAKATFAHKFKSFFNIGSAREDNRRAIEEIKNMLRTSPEFYGVRDRIDELFAGINTKRALYSSDITAVFNSIRQIDAQNPVTVSGIVTSRLAVMGMPQGVVDGEAGTVFRYVAEDYVKHFGEETDYENLDIPQRLAEVRERTDDLYAIAGDNEELKEALSKNFRRFFFSGGGELRTAEKAHAMMTDLRDCLARVDQICQGSDQIVRDYAADMILDGAKPVPDAAIHEPLAKAATLPTNLLMGIEDNADSIYNALRDFIRAFAGVSLTFPEGFEPDPGYQSNATLTMLAKAIADMPREEIENLFDRMTTGEGVNVMNHLADCVSTSPSLSMVYGTATFMLRIAGEILGREIPVFDGGADETRVTVNMLKGTGATTMVSGPGSNKVSKALGLRRFGDIDAFTEHLNHCGRGWMQVAFSSEMRKLAADDVNKTGCVFGKDIERSLSVSLPDGTKLERDYARAKDQLARFSTGNPDATYNGLDPVAKNRVRIMMALLSQETEKVLFQGVDFALGKPSLLVESGAAGDEDKSRREFTLSQTPDGGIRIHYEILRFGEMLCAGDETFRLGAGSRQEGVIDIKVSGEEVERLAAQDWSHVEDDVAAYMAAHRKEPMALVNAADNMPNEARINMDLECHSRYKLA